VRLRRECTDAAGIIGVLIFPRSVIGSFYCYACSLAACCMKLQLVCCVITIADVRARAWHAQAAGG